VKLDPGAHVFMHSGLLLNPGVTPSYTSCLPPPRPGTPRAEGVGGGWGGRGGGLRDRVSGFEFGSHYVKNWLW
jgi:hypothetical protein